MTKVDEQIPVLEAEDKATIVDPQAIADLMQALERVSRIGVYYPAGHTLCDQAADHFRSAMTRVVGKSAFLHLELIGEVLHVQGVELDPEQREVKHFQELLDDVGISGVDIDAEISAEELHSFVTKLLAYRNMIQGARSFQQVEIENMPLSVRIRQCEFIARTNSDSVAAGEGDPSQPSIDTLLSSLARQGLTTDQLAQCRRLLRTIPTDLKERQTAGGTRLQVTWGDVEKLLLRTVKLNPNADWGSSGESSTSHQNLNALAAMFESLGQGDDADTSREAIDLLVTLTRRSTPESTDEESAGEKVEDENPPLSKPQDRSGFDRPEASLDELRAALQACAAKASGETTGPVDLAEQDRRQELSILMQMLQHDQKQQVQVRIQKRLRDNLTAELQPDEWYIVVEGVRQLTQQQDDQHLADAILMMTDALRHSEHATPLALLGDVCRDCSPATLAILWPYVVNEILVSGKRPDPKAFRELCAVVASLPQEVMEKGLPRLTRLEVLRDKHIAMDIFEPLPAVLYPVFAQLLGSPRAAFVGERLVRGLRRAPPGWIGEAVVPLLVRFHPKYRRFLVELLRRSDHQKPAAALTKSAGTIVGDLLPAVPHKQRRQSWVPVTIRAVSRLPVADARVLLHGIIHGRRLLIFPEWPTACRQAAREALMELKSRDE